MLLAPLLLTSFSQDSTTADFRLANLFTPGAVLQRDRQLPVWGWAVPGAIVRVELSGGTTPARAEAVAGPDGRWQATLPPRAAGGPFVLKAISGNVTLQSGDILVGDVWICSGQSNMQWSVASSLNPVTEIANAKFPRIRLFSVPTVAVPEPLNDVNAQWEVCSPETVGNFSAVGYFFGRELRRTQQVPIGLIANAWGGMPAESFADRQSLLADPWSKPIVDRYDAAARDNAAEIEAYRRRTVEAQARWADPGLAPEAADWMKVDVPLADWSSVTLPGAWDAPGQPDAGFDGVAWYRKTVTVPAGWVGKDLTLNLGPIDDLDTSYVNGVKVGESKATDPNVWQAVRKYRVPASLVTGQELTIAVRVVDNAGGGGLYGTPDQLSLSLATGGTPLSLAGAWRRRWEVRVPSPPTPPQQPFGPYNPSAPMQIFNGMVKPLAPYAVRGAIWYQGESNAWRAEQYQTLLPTMIRSWRATFGQGDFPFYIVSLANFMERNPQPVESDWAELREAQAMAATRVRNAGLAVAIDIGEANDIHPRNKQEVGRRLAVLARRKTYQDISGGLSPSFASAVVRGNRMLLTLAEARGLKTSDGRPPVGFAVAGADRKFVWANARIVSGRIEVWSPSVAKPLAVRYGWSANPDVNVVNGEDLPLVPFRTDRWPLTTAGRR